jgi:hypothetical protein
VIELAVANGTRVFVGALDPGQKAYVDADWLTGVTTGPVPALIATASSVASTWDGATFAGSNEEPAGKVVADLLGGVAAAAAAAAASARCPEVAGSGLVATTVRALLDSDEKHDQPDLIVESRGDPASLVESTGRVADLGTVVLAGVPAVDPFRFDLYPDVHVRGLRLVALRLAPDLPRVPAAAPAREAPTDLRLGDAIAEAQWYRVSGG